MLPEEMNTCLLVLQYIFEKKPQDVVRNMTAELRIFLSVPVSVATTEQSFSKLRLIKSYLKSTMSQE
jgi:hypothetical protein